MREKDNRNRVYVWSLPTRIFHWMLAIGVSVAYFLAETKHWLGISHQPVAYVVFSLLLFRILWGFWGPTHSLFKDFKLSKEDAKIFMRNLFRKNQVCIGHNFLASLTLMGILIISFMVIMFGLLSFGIEKGKGALSFMYSPALKSIGFFLGMPMFFL